MVRISATTSDAGFDPNSIVRAVRLLLAYMEAFSIDETDGWLAQDDDPSYQDSLDQGHYPKINEIRKTVDKVDADGEFKFGLDVIIKGLEGQLT